MTTPIWREPVNLYWRKDCFGTSDQALYAGGLCIGYVIKLANPARAERPWRARLMTDEDGKIVGRCATKQEAMDMLVGAAVKEIVR